LFSVHWPATSSLTHYASETPPQPAPPRGLVVAAVGLHHSGRAMGVRFTCGLNLVHVPDVGRAYWQGGERLRQVGARIGLA
jgi:hypothetical protein